MTPERKSRADVAEKVAQRFIDALEGGTVPWSKPWTVDGALPTSASTGKPYRGINAFILALETMDKSYSSPYWATFRQAKTLGGTVRRGEHGTTVVFWKRWDKKDPDDPRADEDGVRHIPLMRSFTVFNLDQCDDVTLPPRMRPEPREPIDVPEAMGELLNYPDGPQVEHRPSVSAFYQPSLDRITLPEVSAFHDAPGYCGTALHELIHSTGHESRLDRFGKSGGPRHFGGERYAAEELVAEVGASMLAGIRGIDVSFDNSAAYVASWLEALQNDRKLIVVAAQRAQAAVDWIVGTDGKSETVAA